MSKIRPIAESEESSITLQDVEFILIDMCL